MSALLEIRGVRKSYGPIHALAGIDLTVPAGGIFGVVGPNGAGKTTLFSVVCGFARADAGEVKVGGEVVKPGSPPAKGSLAILPQDAGLVSTLTIGSQLTFYGRLLGMSGAAASAEARRVLELVDLGDVYGRKPKTMSHGMAKRVGIAQAFIGEPRLIILDEPTAGLDPHAARDVRSLIRSIRGDRTIVVSSHHLGEIEDLCHAVAIIHQGKVVRTDTIAHVVGQAAEIAVRLASPPDDALLARLRSLPGMSGATWDADADRVRVTFNPSETPSGEAARTLVNSLADDRVAFLELQVGKSLEDRFIEETGSA